MRRNHKKSILSYYHNGNYEVFLFSDGTKIRYREDNGPLIPSFPESIDCKITNACMFNCKFCHENSHSKGKDFTEENIKFFDSLVPGTEIALGGGALTTLGSKLKSIVEKLCSKGIVVNTTLNELEIATPLVNEITPYIKGIGISYVSGSNYLFNFAKNNPNTVVHVINGIFDKDAFNKLKDKNLNLLILGYKEFGRGAIVKDEYTKNRKWLYKNLEKIMKHFRCVAFDNLAIDQLEPSRFMSVDEYRRKFMGHDGSATMYVDAVEGKYALNSTTPYSERKNITDDIVEMFQELRDRYGVTNV